MGLFIIAGTIALVGLIFWIIYKVYYEFWAEMVGALCWIAAGAMLFVLLLIMGCNRSNDIVPAMQQDYIILSLRWKRQIVYQITL